MAGYTENQANLFQYANQYVINALLKIMPFVANTVTSGQLLVNSYIKYNPPKTKYKTVPVFNIARCRIQSRNWPFVNAHPRQIMCT
jgi:hypothetical protein